MAKMRLKMAKRSRQEGQDEAQEGQEEAQEGEDEAQQGKEEGEEECHLGQIPVTLDIYRYIYIHIWACILWRRGPT